MRARETIEYLGKNQNDDAPDHTCRDRSFTPIWQRALGNAGGGGFIQDDVLLVVTAVTQPDTSLQVSLTDATAPPNQLPTDLLGPLKIWERPNGSTDDFLDARYANLLALPKAARTQLVSPRMSCSSRLPFANCCD
jgi:hypothetical protein